VLWVRGDVQRKYCIFLGSSNEALCRCQRYRASGHNNLVRVGGHWMGMSAFICALRSVIVSVPLVLYVAVLMELCRVAGILTAFREAVATYIE
jgi:hypothetical protein